MLYNIKNFIDKNKDRLSRLSIEGLWVSIGQIFSLLFALFLVKVLTENLAPNDYGYLALALTLAGLVNQVFLGGIANGFSRYFSVANEENDVNNYLIAILNMLIIATFFVIIFVAILMIAFYILGLAQHLTAILVCSFFALFAGYNAAISNIQNAARNRKIVAFHAGLDGVLKLIFVLFIFFALSPSSVYALWSYAIASFVLLTSHLIFLKKYLINSIGDKLSSPKKEWKTEIWSFSWPFIVWGIFGWGQQSISRWSIEFFANTYEVGLFAVLMQLGFMPIQMIIAFLIAFLQPIFYGRVGDATNLERINNLNKLVNRFVIIGILLTVIAGLLSFALHEVVFEIFVGEEFREISYMLPIIVIAGGIFGTAMLIGSKLFALMSAREAMPASIISSIIGILASIIGVYYFSIIGAIYAILIHAISYFILIIYTKPKQKLKSV